MAAIQRGLFRRLGRRRNHLEYLLPDASLAPAGKAIVDRLVGPYAFGQSAQRQPTFSTCMIPLKLSRLSLRSGPGWFAGRCGSIFAHCSSLNQNECDSIG
jgi:hypothetical protein